MYFGARAYSLDDVEFLAEAGFDFAEIDWRDPDLVCPQMDELAMLRCKYDIDYLAHGPKEGNPFSIDHHATWLDPTVNRLLDLAGEMDIPLYTQHLWLDARFVQPEILAAKVELLDRWAERAQQAGVTLCIENLSEHADHFTPAFEQVSGLDLTLDLGRGEVRRGGEPLHLKPKEYDLLVFLARNRGMVLSRDLILERVWGWDYAGGTRTVDVHVRWLRGKIEADPATPTRLVTVRGIGYRFEG